jgi:hypothetical protein
LEEITVIKSFQDFTTESAPLSLQLRSQSIDVDACLIKMRQHFLTISAINWQ